MNSLEEVAAELKITYAQLRNRLRALQGRFEPYIKKGKKGKILVTQNGLYVLRRMRELEERGMSIADCAQTVISELGLSKNSPNAMLPSTSFKSPHSVDKEISFNQLIEQLRSENEFLKDQLAAKDSQLGKMQDLLTTRITKDVSKSAASAEEALQLS